MWESLLYFCLLLNLLLNHSSALYFLMIVQHCIFWWYPKKGSNSFTFQCNWSGLGKKAAETAKKGNICVYILMVCFLFLNSCTKSKQDLWGKDHSVAEALPSKGYKFPIQPNVSLNKTLFLCMRILCTAQGKGPANLPCSSWDQFKQQCCTEKSCVRLCVGMQKLGGTHQS